jgi:phosphate transport system permease protein
MIILTKHAGFDLARRHRAEQRFQWAGRLAMLTPLAFLVFMAGSILIDAAGVVRRTQIAVTVGLGPDAVDPGDIKSASFGTILKSGLRARFPGVTNRRQKKETL